MELKRLDGENGPFAASSDRRLIYFDGLRRRIQKDIISSIGRTNGLIFLSGEAGVGKTTMLHCLAAEIRARSDCHLLGNTPWLTCREDMTLRDVAVEFSYARSLARSSDVGSLQKFDAGLGGRAAIILDDAHRLSPQVVIQLRRWRRAFQSVRARLSIILAMCLEEDDAAAGVIAGLADAGSQDLLRRLRPFSRHDVERLIQHRLDAAGYAGATPFPPAVVTRVFAHARGNPEKTLRLCRRALALVPDGAGPVSVALVDAAAQIEFMPQAGSGGDAAFGPSFDNSPASVPALPPASEPPPAPELPPTPDLREQTLTGAEPPGRSGIFGPRTRILGLAAAATAVLAVGWFFVANRIDPVNSIAALQYAASERVAAAFTLEQPGGERRDSPVAATVLAEAPPPADAEPVLPTQGETPGRDDLDAVVSDATGSDHQPPLARGGGDSSDAELLEPEVIEAAPPAPEMSEIAPPAPDTDFLASDGAPLEPDMKAAPPAPEMAPAASEDTPLETEVIEAAPPAPEMAPLASDDTALKPEVIEDRPLPAEQNASSGLGGPGVKELLDRGNGLLELGDVAAARLFYAMAWERGSAEGAMLMGLTFDPVYFERKGIYGARPHVVKAAEWYRMSASMGSVTAEEQMTALEPWLRRAAEDGDEDARHALTLLVRP
jgi:type II secretory pathway predicted ATPase ExeA